MRLFTELLARLDETTKTSAKLAALEDYFRAAPPEDAAWALHFLCGRKVKRAVNTRLLREWAAEVSGLPLWLVEECYHNVGDLAETIALLLPPPTREDAGMPLHRLVEERIVALAAMPEEQKRAIVLETWDMLDARERFAWHKLIGGAFRSGVAATLVTRALASVAGVDRAVLAHRLMGDWQPTAEDYRRIVAPGESEEDPARPYPFFLAHPLEQPLEALGPREDWQLEWKWDGIRAQLLRREGEPRLWSRGEELVSAQFPEVTRAALALPPGVVLDGEVLVWRGESPAPFAELQRRLGRKAPGPKVLRELPVAFIAYDLLERDGVDWRGRPLRERRAALEELMASVPAGLPLRVSPLVEGATWEEVATLRGESRARGVEGFMLKRRDSAYGVGRARGDWWKWKVEPFTCDCVLVYAQKGHGRRAGVHSDYTFAVWSGGELAPVMKAYSGLTDKEMAEVDVWIRRHTRERFGPVQAVEPGLVFELAFEGIQRSTRHKSGVAVRFPRIARWRRDKRPEEADRLESLLALLELHGNA